MRIAVLNYATGSVDVFYAPDGENIERYLVEVKGYRMDKIYWMEVKSIYINI